jgi:hypothetical protein
MSLQWCSCQILWKSEIMLDCKELKVKTGCNEMEPNQKKCSDTWQSIKFVWLFVCFESHEQFFSYLATVTITGDRAANLDLCLAHTAFSSEGSFTCHTYCDTGPPFLMSHPKDPWFSLLNAVLLPKEQSLPILNVLGLTRQARAGHELTTSCLLSESTTTRLRQLN